MYMWQPFLKIIYFWNVCVHACIIISVFDNTQFSISFNSNLIWEVKPLACNFRKGFQDDLIH